MTTDIERTHEEITEQIHLAMEEDGRWHGMTYEQGVRAALEWIIDEDEDPPMQA